MENKKLLIILALIVVIGGGLIYYYLNGFTFSSQENNTPAEENTPEENNGTEEPAEEPEEVELTVFAKDEFEMQIPSGWIQTEAPQGIHTLVLNNSEEVLDAESEKAGFKSYMAITQDTLQGKTMEEFKEYVKGILVDSLPSIEFIEEKDAVIQGNNAEILEAKVVQEGYNFRTLLAIIQGEGEGVWTLSFNTAETRWEKSKDLFYQIAESFKLK